MYLFSLSGRRYVTRGTGRVRTTPHAHVLLYPPAKFLYARTRRNFFARSSISYGTMRENSPRNFLRTCCEMSEMKGKNSMRMRTRAISPFLASDSVRNFRHYRARYFHITLRVVSMAVEFTSIIHVTLVYIFEIVGSERGTIGTSLTSICFFCFVFNSCLNLLARSDLFALTALYVLLEIFARTGVIIDTSTCCL